MIVDGKLTTAEFYSWKNPTKYLPQARLRFIRYDGYLLKPKKT